MDELVTVRESVHLGPFQTEIIEGWVRPLLGDTAHIMVTPLKVGEGQPRDLRPLPSRLHVLHAYMCLKNGSGKVSLVVRNMSNSHIFLKKGVLVMWVMSASLVPPTELSLEMEAVLGMEARPEPHIGGGRAGEAAAETEPGWAGSLVPRKCCSSEGASLSLPWCICIGVQRVGLH